MIELYSFPKPDNPNLFNASPFCAKTEAYLKYNNIDFRYKAFNGNPAKFPKGKLPVIKHDNKTVCDSWFIEEYLNKTFNIDLDKHLNETDQGISFAYRKMFDEYLYWAILNERWMVDENFTQLKKSFFAHVPGVLRSFITNIVRKGQEKRLNGHGMGNHDTDEIHRLGARCVDAFAKLLGDRQFAFGDQVSSLDITAWAYLSNIKYLDLNPRLQAALNEHANLESYIQRMNEQLKV